jgi:hypothetical protein
MGRAWTGSTVYHHLSGELATAEGKVFERRALPLIRLIWPDALGTPALRSFDRSGIDHLVWSDTEPFRLVIQCKGFEVLEEEFGDSQIEQCRKSIASFRDSGLKANLYILLHNRLGKNASFREEIKAELLQLVESGQVNKAELWDRQTFIRAAFNKMVERVRSVIAKKQRSDQEDYGEPQICEPLEQVPLEVSSLVVNQYHLVSESPPVLRQTDPSRELLDFRQSNLLVLLGEAGYGKTTAAHRSFAASDHWVFYIPAASIPDKVNNTKSLLQECVRLDDLFIGVEDSDIPTQSRLVSSVLKYLLRDEETPIVLILDGLDESVYFSRRGGLQSLFNQLRDIYVPVVLTARTEFWASRQSDFATSFGQIARKLERSSIGRRAKIINLLPWQDEQILLLTERYCETLGDVQQRSHLEEFMEMIKKGEYQALYGDIPRRPLFLRFILETVAAHGVRRTGRARLFYDWATDKILRDISEPRKWGSSGREQLSSDSEPSDVTLRLSFRAMMCAAFSMTSIREGVLELQSSCEISDLLQRDKQLAQIVDPTGLFLNSLLIPIPGSLAHEPLRVAFAHRAYQEFFLALYLKENPDQLQGFVIPDSIREYMNDLDDEDIVAKSRA